MTIAGAVLGLFDLAFCVAVLTVGKHWLSLGVDALQTLTAVMLVFNGQAVFYVVRERRRMWSSYPSSAVIAASVTDILIIPSLAFSGVFMSPLSLPIISGLFASAIVLAFALDSVKAAIFARLRMAE